MFDRGFKERKEKKVTLPEDEASLILRMLVCMYTGVYKFANHIPEFQNPKSLPDRYEFQGSDKTNIKAAELAVRLFQLGDKYEICELKVAAHQGLLEVANGLEHLHDSKAFAQLVHDIYDLTAAKHHSMTDIVVHVAKRAVHDCGALQSDTFQQLLRDQHDFCLEMASTTYTNTAPICKICNKVGSAVNWRCLCGQLESCWNLQCKLERDRRSICMTCARVGTLEYLFKNYRNSRAVPRM